MRAFVAVELPAAVRQALEQAVEPVRDAHPELAWSPAARWHLTLTFLADLPEEALPDLMQRLHRATSRTAPFELSLEGTGQFGLRVAYAAVTGDLTAVRRLAERTTAAARRCGVAVPEGRFRPHVTLARARREIGVGAAMPQLRAALDSLQTQAWRVESVALVRSTLGAVPRHEVIGQMSLGSTG